MVLGGRPQSCSRCFGHTNRGLTINYRCDDDEKTPSAEIIQPSSYPSYLLVGLQHGLR